MECGVKNWLSGVRVNRHVPLNHVRYTQLQIFLRVTFSRVQNSVVHHTLIRPI